MESVHIHNNKLCFCCIETPMGLFCRYYQHFVQNLQPVKMSQYMFSISLLSKKEHTVIFNATCDQIKNRMIIEHVRHHSSSYLYTFLDVLRKTEDFISLDMLLNGMYACNYIPTYTYLT